MIKMDWNGYARYYDWEFDLICTEQRKDVNLWLNLAERFGDPILELCCGSGRITIPLLRKGFTITAVDNSPQMLQILQKKAGNKVETVLSDMTSFHMKKKYKFAFISYSSFQQLLTQKEQLECLQRINEHLEDGGVLALDINPCICDGSDILEKTHHYTAEFPPGNSTVTMYTSHRIDRKNQVKHWEDTYLEIDKAGNEKTFVNHISLKECSIKEMKKLLNKCGFEIEKIYGDFDLGPVKEDSSNLIYIARKRC
jgi:ubiquinone/menaquinone biosynthesis C-methylase UbiE